MITREDIERFIEKIPPAPKAIKETIGFLRAGEIGKAAKAAKEDLALSSFLRNLVNKPIYGFQNEVKDIAQMFLILGVSKSLQVLYNYLLNLISPDKWSFFKLNKKSFNDLQDELSVSWSKILRYLKIEDKEIESAISLLPSAVIVLEALFNDKKENVEIIRNTKDLDLDTILQRLSGYRLFDICEMIARKWEMDQKVIRIIKAASGKENIEEGEEKKLGKWMHLLLFFILSRPPYIEAGLNDFIEFNVEYVSDIYEEFMQVMEIES